MIPSHPIIIVSTIRRKFGGTLDLVATSYEPRWQHIAPTGRVSSTRAKGRPIR